MKLNTIIWVFLLTVFTSCVNELAPSMTNKLLTDNFKVKVTNHRGVIGQSSITYHFKKKSDSVNVKIIHHFISPEEKFKINISHSTFEEIKHQILCLSHDADHIDKEHYYQLFDNKYLITSGLNKVFIIPKIRDTCKFYYLIPEYE